MSKYPTLNPALVIDLMGLNILFQYLFFLCTLLLTAKL